MTTGASALHAGVSTADLHRIVNAMDGISIGRSSAAVTRNNRSSSFEDFFSPLYPMLINQSWLVDGALFSFPDDQASEFASDVIAQHSDCQYLRPGSVERWAPHLVDDWCTFLGFSGIVDDPTALVKAFAGGVTDARIVAMTPAPDVVFHCVDAARWTFYARDEALLAIVREHIASRDGLQTWNLRLGEDVT